jgi:hypothetical protein
MTAITSSLDSSFIVSSTFPSTDSSTIPSLEIEVRALYKLCTEQRQIQDSLKGQHLESLSIPSICSQSGGALVNRASNRLVLLFFTTNHYTSTVIGKDFY